MTQSALAKWGRKAHKVNIGLYVFGVLSLTGAATGGSASIYGPDDTTLLLTVAIVAAIFGMALDIGFGAGMGALGGLIGKSMYDKAHPNPYAGFPGFYPPPGMYPPPGAYV